MVATSGRCATCARPTISTGTCSASTATSCAAPAARAAVVRDRKTGFCLGDRYAVTTRDLPASAPEAGVHEPLRARAARPDRHPRGDLGRLRRRLQREPRGPVPAARPACAAGRYVLVHRVNADRRLVEASYDNNASSSLLRLRRRRGVPESPRGLPRPRRAPPRVTVRRRRGPRPRRARRAVETVATGLEIPWEIAFLPDGRALVTERPGRVRLLTRGGRLRRAPVARVPVTALGEGGLLGLAVDPAFARNRFVYLYFTTATGMQLERRRWTGSRLVDPASLVDGIRAGRIHDSGRIAFGPDRRLYVSTGDAGDAALAQDPVSRNGKLLALMPGQYRGPGHAAPHVVATGLRNRQGFDWQPGSGGCSPPTTDRAGSTVPRATTRSTRSSPAATTAGRPRSAPTRAAVASPRRCASTAIRSHRRGDVREPPRLALDRRLPARRPPRLAAAAARPAQRTRDSRPVVAPLAVRAPANGRRGPARLPLRAHQQPRRTRLPHRHRRPDPPAPPARRAALPLGTNVNCAGGEAGVRRRR